MKKFFKRLGIIVGVLAVLAGVFYGWASIQTSRLLSRQLHAHDVDFPVPFPLTDSEVAAIREQRLAALSGAEDSAPDEAVEAADDPSEAPRPLDPLEGVDLEAIALERAVARGEHLVAARYACIECHGQDFSGGEMINDPMFAVLLGPNLTGGEGGRVARYTTSDWDRAVRHGILPDGRPSTMPAEDYQLMSDQELSDIIAYTRTVLPVDNVVPTPSMGPIGTILTALGKLPLAADLIDHPNAEHPRLPPATEPTAEFGRHLAGVCTGCHREEMNGGPILSGDPTWLPARNLTPHADGIGDWEYEDFVTAMRELRRPDGSEVRFPMALMAPYAARMTDVELQALWAHLQSLEPRPTGE